MTTAEVKEKGNRELASVAPFGIEADHPQNCDLMLQSVVGLRLRSRIDMSKPVEWEAGDGEKREDVPKDRPNFPKTPGMQLHIDPKNLQYVVYDPLTEDEKARDRVARGLREIGQISKDMKIKGVETQKKTLDKHRMKTLCREVLGLVQQGHARVVKGPEPTIEDIEELDGRFLLNPGARVANTQPIFEDQWEQYLEKHRFGLADEA